MKITLLDINKNMTDAWSKYFKDIENVEIVHNYFSNFMDENQDVDAIVSPANSFGLMDGGYDKAIIDYFGEKLMKSVQQAILIRWYGEQPVGTSMSVPIKNKIVNGGRYALLIHTPSMRTPEQIVDTRIIYQCMRTTLIEAIKQGVDHVVIPAFGGLTGRVPCEEIAKMMFFAYKQVFNQPKELNWGYALHIAKELNNY